MAEETKKATATKSGEEPGKEAEAPKSPESSEKTEKKIKTKKRTDVEGIVHVRATFNNTIVSITNQKGHVVCWSTPGRHGFKGSRKSTPFAAGVAAENAAKLAVSMGMKRVEVRVRGAGAGRESAIRSIQAAGLEVTSIKDVTGIPHNGCRPPKRRRV